MTIIVYTERKKKHPPLYIFGGLEWARSGLRNKKIEEGKS